MTPVHIDPGDDNTALTVGICIGLLAIISLLIAVVLYRRQKGKPAKSSTSEETDPDPNVEVKDYAIPVNQLQSVYKCFSNNVEETFQAQFLSIKEKSEKLSIDIDTGIRPDHRVRNRYKNIVPYDYNRVKLQTLEDDSDYVNASFINGFRCENKYIATQGPLDATLGEFWQMIWEQNCSTIVMLANLYEKNKKKCSQYWPDGQEVAKFGKFSVQMNMEENYGSYVVRSMTLTMDESNCVSASRSVTQYHFTTWPDHGVPATTTGLMRFCSAIEAGSQDVNVPIVVHCSAGVGRTGTYIGLDILKNQIKVENQIDVFETVFNMRKQRIDMVQTLDQYILLHTLLYEICLFGETDFPSEEATSRAQDLERLEAEFGLLEHSEPINASQDAAFSEENSVFNRDPEVLPYDRTLVRLLSNGDDDSSDYANFGYINASVIQEYNCIDTTIVTQGPMATTQCAFWRLILDRSVTAVIMLTDVDENSCDEYWIDELDTQLNIGHVTVTMTAKDVSRPDMTKRQFQVEVKGVLKISVSHIQCNPWKATSNKEIANQLLELIAQSRLLRRDSLPIVVHCKDGAGRSGVFCALSNLLDRCRIENKLDVFRTVKDLRNTRPLMVRTLEDYNLVYETIASCFSDQSLYANV
uniref:Tyrosine-protein phosphatase non-receptor type 20 n=1 Tax=Phallusia mammillata TaxID=59560 RepID=A0A6F9DPB6_9ASCI|nr:receptor-type tyrosine-protein phosphatase epsilon [Phallusia mammillata]